MKELNDLVELAQMATAGGWTTDIRGSVVAVDDQANSGFIICSAGGCDKSHNAAFIAAANPAAILAIAEAFRALEQRSEAAEAALAEEKRINSKLREDRAGLARECNAFEAKLKELEKQKPVGTVSISMDWNTHRNIATVNMRPDLVVAEMKNGDELFTRPAPAVSLADLVPSEEEGWQTNEFKSGRNSMRADILRNIEEQSL